MLVRELSKWFENKIKGGDGMNILETIKVPRIEDWEVREHWCKDWTPVLDEESIVIESKDGFSEKQEALVLLGKRKTRLMNRVYNTHFDEYEIFVNYADGKVYYFDNRKYRKVIDDNKIYLVDHLTGETKMVYDGEFFYPTKTVWLMESSPRLSRTHRLGIEWRANAFRGDPIYIKDHQLIAVLYFGQDALDAVEEDHTLVINHRNLNKHDNRPENLELCTVEENKEHYWVMKPILDEKKAEFSRLVVRVLQQIFGAGVQPIEV
jgi:hypothetical protein